MIYKTFHRKLKIEQLRCSGRASSPCSNSNIRCITSKRYEYHLTIKHEWYGTIQWYNASFIKSKPKILFSWTCIDSLICNFPVIEIGIVIIFLECVRVHVNTEREIRIYRIIVFNESYIETQFIFFNCFSFICNFFKIIFFSIFNQSTKKGQ